MEGGFWGLGSWGRRTSKGTLPLAGQPLGQVTAIEPRQGFTVLLPLWIPNCSWLGAAMQRGVLGGAS